MSLSPGEVEKKTCAQVVRNIAVNFNKQTDLAGVTVRYSGALPKAADMRLFLCMLKIK